MGLKRACGAFLSPLRWSAERRTTTPVWPGSLHSRIAALTLALLVSLPKELSLHPPPAALQFLAPQRRGTMGRQNRYIKVGGLRFLQALTPREHHSRCLIASPSGPLSRHGKGGGGKGQIRPWLPWERFCAQYGLIFGSHRKSIRIQHSQRQESWGRAPSVFCLLLYAQK